MSNFQLSKFYIYKRQKYYLNKPACNFNIKISSNSIITISEKKTLQLLKDTLFIISDIDHGIFNYDKFNRFNFYSVEEKYKVVSETLSSIISKNKMFN